MGQSDGPPLAAPRKAARGAAKDGQIGYLCVTVLCWEETAVVAVIDDRSEAGGGRYIEFRVHRSADDPARIVASWSLGQADKLIDGDRPGTTVLMELRFAVDCADQHGIPFVWVDDPEVLFPPWERR
jgi:hypothetical protein